MTHSDYIDVMPGNQYADKDGATITVTKQTPDGRFAVHHRHGDTYVLSGRTIRQLYPRIVGAVVAAAVLAFAGIAQAKTAPKMIAKAVATVKQQDAALAQNGQITPLAKFTISCTGTAKSISCSEHTGVRACTAGMAWTAYTETFMVSHGALSSRYGLEPAQPNCAENAPMALATITAKAEAQYIARTARPQLEAHIRLNASRYPGMRIVSVTAQCVPNGGTAGYKFDCNLRDGVAYDGTTVTFIQAVDAKANGSWKSVGSPTEVN